jgi:hypothetical protein
MYTDVHYRRKTKLFDIMRNANKVSLFMFFLNVKFKNREYQLYNNEIIWGLKSVSHRA